TADKVKFKQILYNLLSNAIKFTPEEGNIYIVTRMEENNGEISWAPRGLEFLRISIRDTGPGIKPQDRERIFEEFEQLDPSKTTEGTGLGLSLTKKLVEIHGGQIEVGGGYGEGAVFDVYLPYIADEVGEEIPLNHESAAIALPEVKQDNPVVLVAEDDLPTVELLTIHLTQAGYTVAHAYNGAEAIAKARELKPFVITLDIMLPKKDGWEVLQELKADPATKDIPVVIHSIIENRELGFALGATDYLVKPVDQSALTDKIRGLIKDTRRKHSPASVLLISGDGATQDRLYKSLQDEGLLLHSAVDEDVGIELACATRPNAIMVDVEDPKKGFETIKKLRGNPSLKEIPLFVLTSKDLPAAERAAVTGQVERILRKDTLSSGELVGHLKSLEVLYPEKAGLVDEITMLFNRRYLKIRMSQETSRAKRYKMPLVFFNIDIDHFGHYVSNKGTYYGNLVLKKVAELLKRSIRGSDVLVRYGRSSFGLILTNTFLNSGAVLARRFLSMTHDYPFLYEDVQPGGKITISIGASEFSGQGGDDLISHSESALFEAKKKGGNRLEFHHNGDPR
ncbi:MAG: diguanylate cyclase, partial [Deltaproteobacteria bacterium]